MDEPIERKRSKEREEEESKGEQRAHQAHVVAINCTLLVVLVVCYDGDLVVADTFLCVYILLCGTLVCQVCAQKAVAFLCVDCQTYQCEACCAARHLHVESFAAHLYFCVEGEYSSSRHAMLLFSAAAGLYLDIWWLECVLQARRPPSFAMPSGHPSSWRWRR